MREKLSSLMKDFKSQALVSDLWMDVKQKDLEENLKNVQVSFDWKKNMVNVMSQAKDYKNRPLFEWQMFTDSGDIKAIRRTGKTETTVESKVDPATLDSEKSQEKIDEVEASYSQAGGVPKVDPAEMQRDMAFKILFFFISFIAATFSLLYAYFKI